MPMKSLVPCLGGFMCLAAAVPLNADVLNLGPAEFVPAGGIDIAVPGYSVPSFVPWDGDDLPDLVVGEGSGTYTPKVRVYLNVGTESAPLFTTYFYAQANGSDLTVPGGG